MLRNLYQKNPFIKLEKKLDLCAFIDKTNYWDPKCTKMQQSCFLMIIKIQKVSQKSNQNWFLQINSSLKNIYSLKNVLEE